MEENKPLFCFVHATDLHYEIGNNPEVPEANDRIFCLINDINHLSEKEPLEFVIFTGDITNKGSANIDELSKIRSLLDNNLKVPYYVIAGNHDLAPNRKIAASYPGKEDYHEGIIETSNYARIFNNGIKFSFQRCGYNFIGFSLRDKDPDGILDWVEHKIERTKGRIILISHYGLYPARDAGPMYKWDFVRIGSLIPRLREIVNRKNKVILYLYGHNHINSVLVKDGIYHISSGGIQKGCTGYRLFKCYKNRIETSFFLLSDTSLHNFEYWNKDGICIDSHHHTSLEYHRGNEKEQNFIIKV
ncbi:metallophosphoesterase [Candidatus Calescamantes bacterium]|nr:metallophosphoesterase [Candidatus Calescamantes bacterium]